MLSTVLVTTCSYRVIPANSPSLSSRLAAFSHLDSLHWDGPERWGWVREGNYTGEASEPSTTSQQPQLHHHGRAPAALLIPPRPCSSLFGFQSLIQQPPTTHLLSSQHGNPLPVEAVLPEAGLLPGQLWVHLGNDAAALHHSATSQPREQRRAEAANPGPQQALHKGSGWGEPECHGWALCGHHDGLRWVTLHSGLLAFKQGQRLRGDAHA